MRKRKRKLLATLVQEAFSYELSLNRPVDPHSGTNATIELNPKAVEYLLHPDEGRKLIDEALARMTHYATYKYLTPVGYHGLSNSAGLVEAASPDVAMEGFAASITSAIDKMYFTFKRRFSNNGIDRDYDKTFFSGNDPLLGHIRKQLEKGVLANEEKIVTELNKVVPELDYESETAAYRREVASLNPVMFCAFNKASTYNALVKALTGFLTQLESSKVLSAINQPDVVRSEEKARQVIASCRAISGTAFVKRLRAEGLSSMKPNDLEQYFANYGAKEKHGYKTLGEVEAVLLGLDSRSKFIVETEYLVERLKKLEKEFVQFEKAGEILVKLREDNLAEEGLQALKTQMPLVVDFLDSTSAAMAFIDGVVLAVMDTVNHGISNFKAERNRLLNIAIEANDNGGLALESLDVMSGELCQTNADVSLSMEGIDEIYSTAIGEFRNILAKRVSRSPARIQKYSGLLEELNALTARLKNEISDEKELEIIDTIRSIESLYQFLDKPIGEELESHALKVHRVKVVEEYYFHQKVNAEMYGLLCEVKNNGPIVEKVQALYNWALGIRDCDSSFQKAMEQFDTCHTAPGPGTFTLAENAIDRAKTSEFFNVLRTTTDVEKFFPPLSDAKKVVAFEKELWKLGDAIDPLFTPLQPKQCTLNELNDRVVKELIALEQFKKINALSENAGGECLDARELVAYRDFLNAIKVVIGTVCNYAAALSMAARNMVRTRIYLLDGLANKHEVSFTMEGNDVSPELDIFLAEGAVVSQEGIVDFFRKIFSKKKKRPESAELLLLELEKESQRWKNPSARALIEGKISQLPQSLLDKLTEIAKEDFAPSMWRSKELKKFYDFSVDVNRIEDIAADTYEETKNVKNEAELVALYQKLFKNMREFLDLCKRYGIEKRPDLKPVAVPPEELYKDVTVNMAASMAMFEKGWSSREGGGWLIHETKYYGWCLGVLEDAFEHPILSEMDDEKVDELRNECDKLYEALEARFNWLHHPNYDLECYIREARLAVLKLGEQIEEGKHENLVMEEIDDREVVRLLSEGVCVSQEGFIDIVRRLFASKRQKPEQALENLEKAAQSWKNPMARALVDGTADNLPEAFAEKLVKLSQEEFAPCQWQSKELKPFTECYIEGASSIPDIGEGLYEEFKEAKDRKQLEAVFAKARANIKAHIALAAKYKLSLDHKPKYVKAPASELYLDLTKRLPESVKFAEKAQGKHGYHVVYSIQYYGWFFSALADEDSSGLEDYSPEEIKAIHAEFKQLEEGLEDLYEWNNTPADDARRFIKQGRLMLLQFAQQIEKGKDENVAMEGLVSSIFDFLRGKKKPVETKEVAPAADIRPDRLGFGYDESDDLAEAFLEKTKYRGGDFDIQALTGDRFTITASLLKKPVTNRAAILQWFETNCPENKGKVETFYRIFEERVGADTCVLPLWLGSKHTNLMRLWSTVGKEIKKLPYRDPTPADVAKLKRIWDNSGFAQLAQQTMDHDIHDLSYKDIMDELFVGAKPVDATAYEKAALGVNCLYSQIGSFEVYRHWGTAQVIGEENFIWSALFGKFEDKYCQVDYEWRSTLGDLFILAWHIGNLSGKRA